MKLPTPGRDGPVLRAGADSSNFPFALFQRGDEHVWCPSLLFRQRWLPLVMRVQYMYYPLHWKLSRERGEGPFTGEPKGPGGLQRRRTAWPASKTALPPRQAQSSYDGARTFGVFDTRKYPQKAHPNLMGRKKYNRRRSKKLPKLAKQFPTYTASFLSNTTQSPYVLPT